jgi:hypothetical protein
MNKISLKDIRSVKIPLFSSVLIRIAANNTTVPPTCHAPPMNPPWYASPYALLFFVLTVVGIIIIAYFLMKRRKALKRAYQQRDVPIEITDVLDGHNEGNNP